VDSSRFDAWTRRRFGIATAGIVAGLLGLGERDDAPAKRKRKRKRRKQKQKPKCEQHRTRCNPKNDKELCCGGLACDEVPELGGHHCCRQLFGDCQQDSDCCANTVCTAAGFCELQLERQPG
jgi:hypothetical protein